MRVLTPAGKSVEIGDGQSICQPLHIPGYDQAVTEENLHRHLAFLALGDDSGLFNERIAGVDVRPLTTRHLLWLEISRSCFLTGELITEENVIQEFVKFLRIVGVEPRRRWWHWRRLDPIARNRAMVKAMWHENAEKIAREIQDYISDAFADAPAKKGDKQSEKSYYSMGATVCLFLASKMKMPPAQALDVPLKVFFQLMKAYRHSVDPKAILFNRTDELISKHLMGLKN